MSTTIRAKVRRVTKIAGAWTTTLYLNGAIEDSNISFSWPEAMQRAHMMVASLDRALMDEVHASRATRRTEREQQA